MIIIIHESYLDSDGNALPMSEDTCGIEGCSAPAVKSYSAKVCIQAGLKPANDKAKRVHLCKEHNKELKKATKTDRLLESSAAR